MNCPNCQNHVFIGQRRCNHCSHVFTEVEVPTLHGQLKKMGLVRGTGESSAEHAKRCRRYLADNFKTVLPDPVQEQIEREDAEEAVRERQAIQAEGDG